MPDVNGAWEWALEQWGLVEDKTCEHGRRASPSAEEMCEKFGLTLYTANTVLRLTDDQREGNLFTKLGISFHDL